MRPDILNPLFAEIAALKGVGPALQRQLERLDIARVSDLLFHLPTGEIERVRTDTVHAGLEGRVVTLAVDVVAHETRGPKSPLRVRVLDAEGNPLDIVFFTDRGGYARQLLPVGERRVVSGRLDSFGQSLQIVHPDHVVAPEKSAEIPDREPVYGLTEGLTNRRLRTLVEHAMERVPELPEWAEPSLLAVKHWPCWHTALAAAHANDRDARDRLAYDEMLANQLALLLMRQASRRKGARALRGNGRLLNAMLAALPYRPTSAQQRAIAEILGDIAQAAPMLRLLHGDVGSGKTLVALAAMLGAVEAGAQAAMLAPTEILARQHMANVTALLDGVGVRAEILTGREKGAQRKAILADLAAGDIHILVGTHAIFQEAVDYRNLGLVVVDEQHRFGVAQRLMLADKAEKTAHMLVMTATPIPRTLTLTQYGEMDISKLDEMPPGRTPVETRVISQERLDEVVEGVGRLLEDGGRAYWVCPLVDESEVAGDLAAADARHVMLKDRFGPVVGLVHGRMKGPEKDAVMADFQSGRIRLLVATTVVEVGVDVPEASLMIIEQAERFGLAQLHQLRGRVGRGAARSVCLLVRAPNISETARKRLALIKGTNDGFAIAEEDLKLRGGGELLGVRQSGDPEFRVATPEQVAALVESARDDARLLVEHEGGLSGRRGDAARILLYLFGRDSAVGLLRSG
ncbi:ATP-dependent DNA helicase RecG [Sphingosinicella soli]|uniref:Probable DNA 3'-5' helicase RecG n=1 Tax=Sphingosinicella soli TaxID=333708 RepID=A0A7W7B328_9SPHN|nr:ATP-dependent DNA helicase RecG [Sphingosinicella soli]MBB4633129.1 ATP-dependent DNA helicase RecG [Sphingosinicella soli]